MVSIVAAPCGFFASSAAWWPIPPCVVVTGDDAVLIDVTYTPDPGVCQGVNNRRRIARRIASCREFMICPLPRANDLSAS